MFADYVALLKGLSQEERERTVSSKSIWYRAYLTFLAFPPIYEQ